MRFFTSDLGHLEAGFILDLAFFMEIRMHFGSTIAKKRLDKAKIGQKSKKRGVDPLLDYFFLKGGPFLTPFLTPPKVVENRFFRNSCSGYHQILGFSGFSDFWIFWCQKVVPPKKVLFFHFFKKFSEVRSTQKSCFFVLTFLEKSGF